MRLFNKHSHFLKKSQGSTVSISCIITLTSKTENYGYELFSDYVKINYVTLSNHFSVQNKNWLELTKTLSIATIYGSNKSLNHLVGGFVVR